MPPAWAPSATEPEPEAKVAAAGLVQIVGTYGRGGGSLEETQARLRDAGLAPSLADAVVPLLDADGAGSVEIVYPQLGGLEPTEASVMVVARFTIDGSSVVRTVDVRLARTASGWQPTAIASIGGSPPVEQRASESALSLLDNARVELPDSARWDLEAGLVDDRVVELVRLLVERHRVAVTVFGSGHPLNVFGTDRTSNHTAGRGVDIWGIDGVPVADQQQSPVIAAIVQLALDAGATEIGAPADPDGPGGTIFTNTVHQDHLHLAFKR
jgi:hypothetical protein